MENARILWVDDEIDALKPHCLFLEARGFAVHTANNAADALELVLAEWQLKQLSASKGRIRFSKNSMRAPSSGPGG